MRTYVRAYACANARTCKIKNNFNLFLYLKKYKKVIFYWFLYDFIIYKYKIMYIFYRTRARTYVRSRIMRTRACAYTCSRVYMRVWARVRARARAHNARSRAYARARTRAYSLARTREHARARKVIIDWW